MVLLVCDGTCLERGLHLLKQILELAQIKDCGTPVILCVNLCDEAQKKGITIDFDLLRDVLQIPVLCCCARSLSCIQQIKKTVHDSAYEKVSYDCLDFSPKQLALETVRYTRPNYRRREEIIDRIVTGPISGGLIMFFMLLSIFWITMSGANIPSSFLWDILFRLEGRLANGLSALGTPSWLIGVGVYGIYRVLAWVVSVMLPPMAIFFPLFTLLEDLGYLPRVAFNMDRTFHKCRACGKQCLTTAMGLGCNAAGVIGCRIIDSPRERLIAIITNSLIPCNGRLPTLFLMITLGFMVTVSSFTGVLGNAWVYPVITALLMTFVILLGIGGTLIVSWLLSHTLLKGIPSAFTLELPPYRRPQIGKVIVRSIFDRTLFVLGRAVIVAAPAGLIIWILANILYVGPSQGFFALSGNLPSSSPSLLSCINGFFDPLGRLMGLDGVILTAFILGFPANEIVIPIILMTYLQTGALTDMSDSTALLTLLTSHGWTVRTMVCMTLFCLFHWPCSTTVLTIKKETKSIKWTAVSILIPTLIGVTLCMLVTGITNLAALFV